MQLKMREGYVPPPQLSPAEVMKEQLERLSPIYMSDKLNRWLVVGSYAIAPDRIERIAITSGNRPHHQTLRRNELNRQRSRRSVGPKSGQGYRM